MPRGSGGGEQHAAGRGAPEKAAGAEAKARNERSSKPTPKSSPTERTSRHDGSKGGSEHAGTSAPRGVAERAAAGTAAAPEVKPPAPAGFHTFQPASIVIGQQDFTSGNASSRPTAGTLQQPYGDPAVAPGVLFLPDFGNNRILGFRVLPSVNGARADFVLGQAAFGEDAFGTGRGRMRAPLTLRTAAGKLFAVDHFQHRVLIWNEVPSSSDAPADVVVGQADFGAGTSGACAPDRLYVPMSLAVAAGKLLVSDGFHHRVLVWNSIPARSGAPADLVLGQPDLTTCASAREPSARTLSFPGGLWSDGRRLIVADQQNHRVLIWNTFPTRNQAPADVVLGQAGMDARAPNTTAGTFRRPMSVAVGDGGRLFVSDHDNNRVLVWNAIPRDSGTPADAVLGQADFTHGTRNDDDQDGRPDARPSARTLNGPAGLVVTAQGLLIGDEGNHRFLLFQGGQRGARR